MQSLKLVKNWIYSHLFTRIGRCTEDQDLGLRHVRQAFCQIPSPARGWIHVAVARSYMEILESRWKRISAETASSILLFVLRKYSTGAGRIAQCLRSETTLFVDLNAVPIIFVGWLTTAYNSNSRGSRVVQGHLYFSTYYHHHTRDKHTK